MLFYQIYNELKKLKENNTELEELLISVMKTAMKTKKREEALYLRVNELENKIKDLTTDKEKTKDEIEEMNNELTYKNNEMVCVINTIIGEVNYIIAILNNKHQEN